MKGLSLLALVGFILANIIERTPFALTEMQSAVIMLMVVLGLAELTSSILPGRKSTTKSAAREKSVSTSAVAESHIPESVTSDVPPWGTTPQYSLNPDAGKSEHGRFGL